MSVPTRLDRYPAKMVSRLADELVARYASTDATGFLDPFCGSGALLVAAAKRGIPTYGVDINPLAALFTNVKLFSFSCSRAEKMLNEWISLAESKEYFFPVSWPTKQYWFTPATLDKLEQLRGSSIPLRLSGSREGTALLLAFALTIRLCSKADQRSPKPFISKQAKQSRSGKHFDPYQTMRSIFCQLAKLYGGQSPNTSYQFYQADIVRDPTISTRIGIHSHVMTSPPYINAQDYYRNFKLELYLLEGMLSFTIDCLRDRFVGTERGNLLEGISHEMMDSNCKRIIGLRKLEHTHNRLAAVVHRYFSDMDAAFVNIKKCLMKNGIFVLVCGDNLVGGLRIKTYEILTQILEEKGFKLVDTFSDPICDRLLPPKRAGHKGLIKEEVICAFTLG